MKCIDVYVNNNTVLDFFFSIKKITNFLFYFKRNLINYFDWFVSFLIYRCAHVESEREREREKRPACQ
jgi:hypothetical protein